MMYTLDKYSIPGFTFQTNDIGYVRWLLEQQVCDWCKWTGKDYADLDQDEKDACGADDVAEGVNPFTFTNFFPENYSELTDQEKIDILLDTACGCEYGFTEKKSADNESTKAV